MICRGNLLYPPSSSCHVMQLQRLAAYIFIKGLIRLENQRQKTGLLQLKIWVFSNYVLFYLFGFPAPKHKQQKQFADPRRLTPEEEPFWHSKAESAKESFSATLAQGNEYSRALTLTRGQNLRGNWMAGSRGKRVKFKQWHTVEVGFVETVLELLR